MLSVYLLFAVFGVWAECSSDIDTRNLLKKIGLGLIVLGCLVELSGNDNQLLEWGAMCYIIADMYRKYKEKWLTS